MRKATAGRAIKPLLIYLGLGVLLLIMFPVSILAGQGDKVGLIAVARGIFSGDDFVVNTLIKVNMPRTLVALFSGATLSVAGVMFQSVTKNRLADPAIIGVSSSAYACTLFISLTFPAIMAFSPLISAVFAGALFALVCFLSYSGGLKSNKILAIGSAVNAIFMVIILTIAVMKGIGAGNILLSAVGSLGVPGSDVVLITSILTCVGILAAFLMAGKCNVLALGDKTAHGLGINVLRTKILLSAIGVFLTAVAAANVGITAFLGLLSPMLAKKLLGKNHYHVLPLSALLGGILLLLTDIIGRGLGTPVTLPVGIIATVVGGVIFLIIFGRQANAD